MFDGTCYKIFDGKYRECKLEGGEEYFTDIYLGRPCELDANKYAYEKTKTIYGELEELNKLFHFWLPSKPIAAEEYKKIYEGIDAKVRY